MATYLINFISFNFRKKQFLVDNKLTTGCLITLLDERFDGVPCYFRDYIIAEYIFLYWRGTGKNLKINIDGINFIKAYNLNPNCVNYLSLNLRN